MVNQTEETSMRSAALDLWLYFILSASGRAQHLTATGPSINVSTICRVGGDLRPGSEDRSAHNALQTRLSVGRNSLPRRDPRGNPAVAYASEAYARYASAMAESNARAACGAGTRRSKNHDARGRSPGRPLPAVTADTTAPAALRHRMSTGNHVIAGGIKTSQRRCERAVDGLAFAGRTRRRSVCRLMDERCESIWNIGSRARAAVPVHLTNSIQRSRRRTSSLWEWERPRRLAQDSLQLSLQVVVAVKAMGQSESPRLIGRAGTTFDQ